MAAAAQEEDEEIISGINVTPLVDITLVLLIIFMATAHMISHRSMNLALPKVAHSDTSVTPTVQIMLTAEKALMIDNKPTTAKALADELAHMAGLDAGIKVTVLADQRVSWGDMAAVLDTVRGAGVTRIATEVQPK